MIKKLMIKRKIVKSLKQRNLLKSIKNKSNERVGLIINYEDLNNLYSIESITKALADHVGSVDILTFIPNIKNIPNEFILKGYNYFTASDFNVYGEMVSKKVIDFVGINYDRLYVINSKRNHYIDLLVASSKAGIRMGLYQQNRKDVYELSIELEKYSTDLLISHLNTYSKLIS